MAKAPPKLDIFKLLSASDQRDFEFLSDQTEEARKAFAPVVALRWASAVEGALSDYAILAANKKANLHFFDISDHPDLQYRLIASTGTGKSLRHYWVPVAKKEHGVSALHSYLSKYWPDANEDELNLILSQFDLESFKAFVMTENDGAKAKQLIDAFKRAREDNGAEKTE